MILMVSEFPVWAPQCAYHLGKIPFIPHTAFLISELPPVSGLGIGQMSIFFPVNHFEWHHCFNSSFISSTQLKFNFKDINLGK